MWEMIAKWFGWPPRTPDYGPVFPDPQPDADGIEELLDRYCERSKPDDDPGQAMIRQALRDDLRRLIEPAVREIFERAKTDKRVNLATFNFARYVAGVVFLNSVGKFPQS